MDQKWIYLPSPGLPKSPVKDGTPVQLRFRCGHETGVRKDAKSFVWRRRPPRRGIKEYDVNGYAGDIIAYRILEG